MKMSDHVHKLSLGVRVSLKRPVSRSPVRQRAMDRENLLRMERDRLIQWYGLFSSVNKYKGLSVPVVASSCLCGFVLHTACWGVRENQSRAEQWAAVSVEGARAKLQRKGSSFPCFIMYVCSGVALQ